MNKPRYIIHKTSFGGSAFYVKIEKGVYSVWTREGKEMPLNYSKEDHKQAIRSTKRFLKEGAWREVPIEELVLII